jgi:5-methylthioadenosine/S-adenosylhomocysteine deaminase
MNASSEAIARRFVDLLVVGPTVVTMDAARSVIPDAAIAIDQGRIVWLGSTAEAQRRFGAKETLAAPGRLALPGLIDTHYHTGQQLLRGKLADLGRRRQLRQPIWRNYLIPFESILEPEDVYLSGLLGYANMLRVGTTCFAEAGGPHPDEMGRAALEIGIRGIVALSTVDMAEDVPATMRLSTQQAISANEALVRRWNGRSDDRVRAWLALRQLIVCSEDLWRAFAELARELDTRVHTHLAEGTYEVDYAAERWGMRPAEYLDSIGMLGPGVHLAHAVLLSDDELGLIASRGASVAHCPMGNFLIGPPKLPQMVARGVAVGIGSDGATTGTIDLFRAVQVSRVALESHWGTPWHQRTVLAPEDLLAVATNGGARALGYGEELGSLEPGKKADIVLLDPGALDLQPVYDPLFTAAGGLSGPDVESVIVDGRIVVKQRVLQTVDEEALRAELARRWPLVMERFEGLVS